MPSRNQLVYTGNTDSFVSKLAGMSDRMRGLSQDDGAAIKIAESLIPELAVLVQHKELHTPQRLFSIARRFHKI